MAKMRTIGADLKLKPCPFCGEEAYVDSMMGNYYIRANHTRKCFCRPDTWIISYKSIRKQAKAWNKRV